MNFKKIFSIYNEEMYKIIYILGFKIKLFRKNYILNDLFITSREIHKILLHNKIISEFLDRGFALPKKEYLYKVSPIIEKIKLADIKWKSWIDGNIYTLEETPQYSFLKSRNEFIYSEYIRLGQENGLTYAWFSLERFLELEKNILELGYDTSKKIILLNAENEVLDGLHRSTILLSKYGKEHEIIIAKVVK